MDALADLKARALKAREFTHSIGERCITLRAPTLQQMRECVHSHSLLAHGSDPMVLPLLQHYMLLDGIVGWTGLRTRDVLSDGDAAPLPWSADAVALYLDAQPDDAIALGDLLFQRMRMRNATIEEDAKN